MLNQDDPGAPANNRRKRRSPEEIMRLLLTGASDEFKRNGYSGATTAAIAKRADVTEAQLFRYFSSKAELFKEAVFKPLNANIVEFAEKYFADIDNMTDKRNRFRLFIDSLQQFVTDNSEELMSLVVARAYEYDNLKFVGELKDMEGIMDRGMDMILSRMQTDPEIDPRILSRVILASILACVIFRDWLFPKSIGSDEQVINTIGEFLIRGIEASFSDRGD